MHYDSVIIRNVSIRSTEYWLEARYFKPLTWLSSGVDQQWNRSVNRFANAIGLSTSTGVKKRRRLKTTNKWRLLLIFNRWWKKSDIFDLFKPTERKELEIFPRQNQTLNKKKIGMLFERDSPIVRWSFSKHRCEDRSLQCWCNSIN